MAAIPPENAGAEETSHPPQQQDDPQRQDDPQQDGTGEEARPPAPGLCIVATPIGNLGDISARALSVLGGADRIACEDTRRARRLPGLGGCGSRLLPYHEHNAARKRPQILDLLTRGERIALVSDSGTPLLSDPGYKLVREAIRQEIPVTCVPGPSAFLAALCLSGLPMHRFTFGGFLPPSPAARRRILGELRSAPGTLAVYESPQRLAACLGDMLAVFGDRDAAVARELTKRHEEVRRGRLSALLAHYEGTTPRGEIVITIAAGDGKGREGKGAGGTLQGNGPDREEVLRALLRLVPGEGVSGVARLVSLCLGIPRREAYLLVVAEGGGGKDEPAAPAAERHRGREAGAHRRDARGALAAAEGVPDRRKKTARRPPRRD